MKTAMKTLSLLAAIGLLAPALPDSVAADDDKSGSRIIVLPNAAKQFAVMPPGAVLPEGITVNPTNREVIVGTFGGAVSLVRFSKSGNQIAAITIPGGPLLGLAYNPKDGRIYICSADDLAGGATESRIRRIDADFTDDSSVVDIAVVPSIGLPDDVTADVARAPNAITFADNGDLYFTDSFQGAVFSIADPASNCPAGGCPDPVTVAHAPLLTTAGFPPFGANGIVFNADESLLFVANTGDDTVLTVDPNDGSVNTFSRSINGADGLAYDRKRNLLWVAANQADQVVAIDPATGRVVAELGEFLGIRRDGSARGLIFPASLALTGNKIVVTNLAAALAGDGSEPEADITTYTVSIINIPNFEYD